MTTQYLDRNQVPQFILNATKYKGQKFNCTAVQDGYTFQTDNAWSGGSKSDYYLIERDSGKIAQFPEVNPLKDKMPVYPLYRGYVLVKHVISRGKDLGLWIYYHQADMPELASSNNQSDLTLAEKLVLCVTKSYKASHRADELYRTLKEHIRRGKIAATDQVVQDLNGKDGYDSVRRSLLAKGLMKKNFALTTKGKNAAEELGGWFSFTHSTFGSLYS